MTDVSNMFLYLSLGLIVLWTVRLARSKGRNPILWGGISLLLMLIPSWPDLLGMGPMLVLLFVKSPQTATQETVPETVTCPKCHAYHAAGHTYCVNCGWELGRDYTHNPQHVSETGAATQIERDPAPAAEQVEQPIEQPARHFSAEVASPVFEPPNEPLAEPRVSQETSPEASTEASASDGVSTDTPPEPELEVQKPVKRYPITPAGFTERGLALMGEDMFQEAIDQFTKAIALDPAYLPAWTRRAEAYEHMGRHGKAEDDRRHLVGLQGQTAG